jgi:predicted TIM-barrel fold metal-dependent hydrolase
MGAIRTNAAAAMLGVSPNTLRSWERRFGFPEPRRTAGGHRQFDLAEIEALRAAFEETQNISSAISVARERGAGPASPARLRSAFTRFDEDGANRLMEESLVVRSVERTVEEVLLPAVEALAGEPGVVGVFVPHAGVAMGRSQMFPIYEAAERHGLPIVLHPTGAEGNLSEAPRVAGGLPDTYPERHSLLLQPGQAILASMIFGGVFDAFPQLQLVLSEYGVTWAPPLVWRMDRAWEQGDRELAGLKRAPSDYVRDNVRFTTQPLDEPPELSQLWALLELVDAGRTLMFSSDYPHWDTDDPQTVMSSRLPAPLRRAIAFENAAECFGSRLGL